VRAIAGAVVGIVRALPGKVKKPIGFAVYWLLHKKFSLFFGGYWLIDYSITSFFHLSRCYNKRKNHKGCFS
jgi:hypothetical protein